ncbi:MAG: RecX family transcriptional regulator [bacterium]|nr:RecX family transcriptional regulator [bacterium]
MPQITDIKPQKKKEDRFNIYVDGKFSFALPAETLVKAGLKINQSVSEEQIERLIKENEFQKAYDKALHFLSFRPRSQRELTDMFSKKDIGEETIKMVMRKLEEQGFLNDEEFAKWWIEQRLNFKPSSRRLLSLELLRKGVAKDLAQSLLDSYIDKDKEYQLAKKTAEKKMGSLKKLPILVRRKKLSEYLGRRGFSWEIIKRVLVKITSYEEDY